jgi:hypothetical protein
MLDVVDAAKPLPSTVGDGEAALTKKTHDEAPAATNASTRSGTAAATAAAATKGELITTEDVEKARGQFHDAIEKAMSLGDGSNPESDLATRFGTLHQARNRVWLERLAYEDLRQRFEGQERKAADDETRRLAVSTTVLAERQAWYARCNFVLALMVALALVAQLAVVAILAWRWRWR